MGNLGGVEEGNSWTAEAMAFLAERDDPRKNLSTATVA